MLKALRGLVLATGVAALPAFAQVDCPSEQSIDRYAETARDALSALDGLVPESQQQSLQNRYAAMSILKWHWQGRDAVTSDPVALNQMAECLSAGPCDAEAAEQSRNLAQFPSDRLLSWARVELGCEAAPEAIVEVPAEPIPETIQPETAPAEPDAIILTDAVEVETDPEPVAPSIETAGPVEIAETVEPDDASEADIALTNVEPALSDAASSDPSLTESTETAPVAVINPADTAPEAPMNDVQNAMRSTVMMLINGNFAGAATSARNACFTEAINHDPAATCEILFDQYDQMASRANPEQFLDFTDHLCALSYERGCASMARYFGVSTTFEALLAAFSHYDRSCNSGDAEACAIVSDYHVAGRTSAADLDRAREALERACNLGRLASCQGLADFYLRGVGGDVDTDRALQINAASCPETNAKQPETCVRAADFVLINLEPGPEKDALIRAFTRRACDIGHGAGCAWFADNLEYGIGGGVDLSAARQARLKACDFGHADSCRARS